MMDRRPTEQELNAYVDGELSPRDDARIAAAVAEDQALAARIATLTHLKSALSGLAEEPRPAIALPRPRRLAGLPTLAASLALLAGLGLWLLAGYPLIGSSSSGGGGGGDGEGEGEGEGGWYRKAQAEHAAWAQTAASPDARAVDANLFLANIERFALPVQTPYLTSARLRLTYLRYLPAANAAPAALHLGYTGRHGCKITLWVTAAPIGQSEALTESRVDALRGFRWRAGDTAYALFATGMAERRFTVIAGKVYEATHARRGFDSDTRMALKSASSSAPPCRA